MAEEGCEMTVWMSPLDNRKCGEPRAEKSYFCPRHVGQLTEEQGKLLAQRAGT